MFITFINRASLAVSAFAPGRVGMRPVPFIPVLHSIVCKEHDQLHAAETAFLTFPVMKVGQPVVLESHLEDYYKEIISTMARIVSSSKYPSGITAQGI